MRESEGGESRDEEIVMINLIVQKEKKKIGIKIKTCRSWWCMLVINKVKRKKQEDYEFKARLGYKKKKKPTITNKK
jgi:hypothetical protein